MEVDSKGPGRFLELSNSTSVAPWSLAQKRFSAEQAEALCLFGSSLNGGKARAFSLGMVMLGFTRKQLGLEGEPVCLASCVWSDVHLESRSMKQDKGERLNYSAQRETL